ncbi:unnamed protein product [Allacma fusca]|uniref:Uncharacterized protein n=1 Tax=Allacma fusca TaxID=39272 RepID=A0A8J2M6W1_9HEXA|nr:unnamed protein product [Allacma fusca]
MGLSLECSGSHLRISDSDKKRMKTQFEITPAEDLNFDLKFQFLSRRNCCSENQNPHRKWNSYSKIENPKSLGIS